MLQARLTNWPVESFRDMKINVNVTLAGEGVVLVPYRKEHVPLYHAWMVSLRAARIK